MKLKPLSPEAVPAALDKAMRYRLLNQPRQAESICRDVLRVEPDNQEALKTLVLALSDQFLHHLDEVFPEAREVLPRLTDDYGRIYHQGIVYERRALTHLRRAGMGSGPIAYDWLRKAMEAYEQAIELRPPGNDEAILRWNTCVRTLERHRALQPAPVEDFEPLLE